MEAGSPVGAEAGGDGKLFGGESGGVDAGGGDGEVDHEEGVGLRGGGRLVVEGWDY